MKKPIQSVSFAFVLLAGMLAGCGISGTSPMPPLSTDEQSSTSAPTVPAATSLPSPTSLPGEESLPLETLGNSIPWLPMENTARPGTTYYLFNLSRPPFTNALVRRAFAAAVDREAIVRIALERGFLNPRAATTFTPPETLGRDLFNVVGVRFDPSGARELLTEAGYTDISNFPAVTLMTNKGPDDSHVQIAEELIRMWKIYLGVDVALEVVTERYFDRAKDDPTEIYFSNWSADYNDPDGFLVMNFHTGAQYNYNHFSNLEFDELVDRAGDSSDPAVRQDLYIQAERILCEVEVALIPLYHRTFNIP